MWGNLYSPKPGIIVRVQGRNLAAMHKYWILFLLQTGILMLLKSYPLLIILTNLFKE